MHTTKLLKSLKHLRAALEPNFSADTAFTSSNAATAPSAGHCAVVALIAHRLMGGELVSARVHDQSHWFNRFVVSGRPLDVDLTGDQFGHSPIWLGRAGTLYPGAVTRSLDQVAPETLERAAQLAERSSFVELARILRAEEETACVPPAKSTAVPGRASDHQLPGRLPPASESR